MGEPDLTESAWRRAKNDAEGVCGRMSFYIAGGLWLGAFSVLSLVAQKGQPVAIQVAVAASTATVAALLSVAAVFACQLAAAPVRQRNELRRASQALKDKAQPGLTQQKNEELIQLTDGIGHMPGPIEVQEWTVYIVDFLVANAAEDLAEAFMAAGADETDARRRFQARLQTLRQIIISLMRR